MTPEEEFSIILSKLGITSRSEAVALALRNHIIP
jgi:DNA-binding CsgD family transcriptional regulator